DDPWGVKWGYDCIKQNQVDWYKAQLLSMKAYNEGKGVAAEDAMPKSTAYFHIPLQEYREAYFALKDAGISTVGNDGANASLPEGITYFEGTFGEDPKKEMV
ncbi:metallophosphoesterase family protein, partial [Clostridium perfringens]|uniref:hypothetical protein n=1 Tax=Clostridium perfringens TaxID=1502 RepID=UPI003754E662